MLPYVPTTFGAMQSPGVVMELGKAKVTIKVHIEIAPGVYELPKVELRDRAGLIHVCGPTTLPIFKMHASGARMAK